MNDVRENTGFTEQPVFQSASYEADYTSNSTTESTDTWGTTPSSNEDIFDE